VSFLPTTTVNGKPRSSKDKLTVSYARKFFGKKITAAASKKKKPTKKSKTPKVKVKKGSAPISILKKTKKFLKNIYKIININNQSKQKKRRGARYHSACSQYIFKIIFKLACIGMKFNDDPPHVSKRCCVYTHSYARYVTSRFWAENYAHNLFHPAWWTKFAG
jgi:hypothetical protein